MNTHWTKSENIMHIISVEQSIISTPVHKIKQIKSPEYTPSRNIGWDYLFPKVFV